MPRLKDFKPGQVVIAPKSWSIKIEKLGACLLFTDAKLAVLDDDLDHNPAVNKGVAATAFTISGREFMVLDEPKRETVLDERGCPEDVTTLDIGAFNRGKAWEKGDLRLQLVQADGYYTIELYKNQIANPPTLKLDKGGQPVTAPYAPEI